MKLIKYLATGLILAASISSCTYHFDKYNENTNQMPLGKISPTSMLEDLLYRGFDDILNRTYQFNGELMQYTVSGTTVNSYHRYTVSNGVMSSAWNSLWQSVGNADHMFEIASARAETKEMRNCKAIALTLKSFYASNITDMWGDMPYSEALKGRNDKNYKPKFDTQEEVYTLILADLETANDYYELTAPIPNPNKDLMYSGDILRWKKFTNSLRLRLLMRLSNRDAEMKVKEQIKKMVEDPAKYPIFTSNGDNAALFYSGSEPFTNRYGSTSEANFTGDRKVAENIVAMMNVAGDPRLPFYFTKKATADWKGLPSGEVFQDGDFDGVSLLNKNSLGLFKSPFAVMRYDEVEFILAEAAKLGIITGGDALAKMHYDAALEASVRWWHSVTDKATPLNEADLRAFIDVRAPYNRTIDIIYNQKYISLFWVGYEAWHEYRRTGFPKLRIGSATDVNNYTLPTRFAYPVMTASTNPDNYAIAIKRLADTYGAKDDMLAPVWWSKRAMGAQ